MNWVEDFQKVEQAAKEAGSMKGTKAMEEKMDRLVMWESEFMQEDPLDSLRAVIREVEHATGQQPLSSLKFRPSVFELLANETDPPMTKTGIGAALGIKIEIV